MARICGRSSGVRQPAPQVSREIYSLERMSLGWAWNDARNAARLAAELLHWGTPPSKWVASDDPEVAAEDTRMQAEEPIGGDPYRTLGEQRVNVDAPEVVDARFEITNLLMYLTAFGEGQPLVPPEGVGSENEHPMTRLYWYADIMGKRIAQTCEYAARVSKGDELRERWRWIGHAAKTATRFIHKIATGNPVIGSIDGAAAGILRDIGAALAYSGKPTDEIIGRMFHWRVKDALKGKELSPEMDANLRPAFEAAWSAGEYEFAYSLLADLDTFATL